jgi:retron-type reverse transcriptase
LEPIFDPGFHPSSYGYRKGRGCHHAISKASLFIRRYRRQWVVDMDLSKCFDTLNHDLIIRQFREKVSDSSILKLLRQFLESGVMVGEEYESTTTGSPQGGVISELNPVLRGFVNYFKIAHCGRELNKLMGWIRRRLRCIQLKQWKKPQKLHRRLKQLGYKPPFKAIKMKSWHNARSPLASFAMPNRWLHEELKLVDMCSTQVGICVSVI